MVAHFTVHALTGPPLVRVYGLSGPVKRIRRRRRFVHLWTRGCINFLDTRRRSGGRSLGVTRVPATSRASHDRGMEEKEEENNKKEKTSYSTGR